MAACMGFLGGGLRSVLCQKQRIYGCTSKNALPALRKYSLDSFKPRKTTVHPLLRKHAPVFLNHGAPVNHMNAHALGPSTSLLFARSFNTSRKDTPEGKETGIDSNKDKLDLDDHGLLVRFNNENGYLSWCRNCYLATTAGAVISGQEAVVPNAKEVGILIIFLGGLNIINGTLSYMYFLVQLRRQGRMSLAASLIQVTLAMLHILLWMAGMAIYIGIVEEEPQDIDTTDIIEIFTKDPNSKR